MITCITGMHRSGTSMIARLLNLCGVYLGEEEDLIPPEKDNPEGFWEHIKFQGINEEILTVFRGSWDAIPDFKKGWQDAPQLSEINKRAQSLIEEFSGKTQWGWKDPRSSITLPFWKKNIPDLKTIICLRNPYEVYRSLTRRGYASSIFSYDLWLKYSQHILDSTSSKNRIVTHFDSYFYDPYAEIRRIFDYLEVDVSDQKINNACKTVSTSQKHHYSNISSLLETSASQQVIETYQELCDQAGFIYSLTLPLDISVSLDTLKSSNAKNGAGKKPFGLFDVVKKRDKRISELEENLKQSEKQIVEWGERETEWGEREVEFRTLLKDKTVELESIYSNRSWRMVQIIQKIRIYFIPLESKREKILHKVFRGLSDFRKTPSLIKSEGIKGLFLRVKNRRSINTPMKASPESTTKIYAEMIAVAKGHRTDTFVELSGEDLSIEELQLRLIAFYLPQFHPIEENDKWWGKGFTEWSNVSKATPQFAEHYQPRLPGELGFYDLRIPAIQKRQIELARKYGVSGFAFYYYWFNGKRLLEKPLDIFLESKEDFPFCICWANENWTRRWDGQENDILIAQEHSPESDRRFIEDVSPILQDRRYIRVNGRPVLIIYRADILPNIKQTVSIWREYCQEHGIGDPYLVAAQTFEFKDPRKVGFDAAVEFPPHNVALTDIRHTVQISNPNYKGNIVNYKEIIEKTSSNTLPEYKLFRTVFPSWDNEARKPERGYTFAFSSPALYKDWLLEAAKFTLREKDPEKQLLFINAWNEWGEGAYLEPDRKYGYAYLQATADVLRELSNKYL